jgi:hypothetical protein
MDVGRGLWILEGLLTTPESGFYHSDGRLMSDGQLPTGERIATEIEREMEERLYPLRNVTLAPAEYHVYLHPDDFADLEFIVPRIVEDVQACLNARVQRLNQPPLWSRVMDLRRYPPIEVPAGGWAVHIKPSTNGELNHGEIGIHSRLAVPASARFGTGAGTVRIAETLVGGEGRKTRTRTEAIAGNADARLKPGPANDGAADDARLKPGPEDSAYGSPTSDAPPPLPRQVTISGPRLVYRDDNGEHVHPITKELTKIGRGGTEHWVDVMVSSGAQVSREHCRIRRDPAGRLFLQDVSTWGTFLNGSPVEKFLEGDPLAHEHELLHGASIRLADAVTLELLLR